MEEKLLILMQTENLTASKLAEKLGVNPPVISHILKGRNDPSYKLVKKFISAFPRINPYWLLGDSDKMYNDSAMTTTADEVADSVEGDLFSGLHTGRAIENPAAGRDSEQTLREAECRPLPELGNGNAAVDKIIITYKDGSFEYYTPRQQKP